MKFSAKKSGSTLPARRAPNLARSLRKFWNDESGQTTTEYVLILAIVLVIISQVRKRLQTTLTTAIDSVDTKMNDAIQ